MTTDLTPVLAALTGLPGSAYEVLYRTGSLHVQQVVAANADTPQPVLEMCLTHPNTVVKKFAAQHLANPNDFTGRHGSVIQQGLLLNPRTDPELLAATAATGATDMARPAMMNPSTPIEAFLDRMTPAHTRDRLGRGNDADRFTRAARVLDAHPGLANVCEWWRSTDHAIVRAVAADPTIDAETAGRILDLPGRSGKAALRLNPYVPVGVYPTHAQVRRRVALGDFADQLPQRPRDLSDLVDTGSPTAHLVLAKAAGDPTSGVGADVASRIAALRGPNTTAHAFAWAARSAPHRVVPGCEDLAHTLLGAASEIAPVLIAQNWPRRYAGTPYSGARLSDTDVATLRQLPDSPNLWVTVTQLLSHTDQPVPDLLEAARAAAS